MTSLADTAALLVAEFVHSQDQVALPHRFGPWQLVRQVAQSELSQVYQARPAHAPQDGAAQYAVKLLKERWQGCSQAVGALRREAMLGRSIAHPHLISVLSAHVGGPPYYLVMPWLQGATLAARLAGGDRPGLAIALWLTRQVVQALEALHHDGWMHADIKPSNVFISPDQHATLMDLGLCRRPQESISLVDRHVAGTVHYMAPEMVTSVWGADIRSDIYSLGVMLYELIAGRLPFTGKAVEDIVRAHVQAAPQPLRDLVPQVPRDVARLVHQMLRKDPLRRPQTPAELIHRLVRLEIAFLAARQPAV